MSISAAAPPHLLPRTPDYLYDVFVSYSHSDREWVHGKLIPSLEDSCLKDCSNSGFESGQSSAFNMEKGVRSSRCVVAVLTPQWVASDWCVFESLIAHDPIGRKGRMAPLKLRECDPPAHIAL